MRDRSGRRAVVLVAVAVVLFAGCTSTVDDSSAPTVPVVVSAAPATAEAALGCELAFGANIDWAGWTGGTEQEALEAMLADFPDVDSTEPWDGPTPYEMGSMWLLYAEGVGYGTAVTFQQELNADGTAGWIATIDRLCDSPPQE